MSQLNIRGFKFPQDYEAAVGLWQSVGEGVHVGPSDSSEQISKKLLRDPELFLVAESENRIVGTVIGGFDGRRGTVYHLAVAPEFRRRGVATRLMRELEDRLQSKGCIRAYLVVRRDNVDAMKYYKATGWDPQDVFLLVKDLA